MSINHDTDYQALADKIAGDDYEPNGPAWSLLDVADIRAYELLRREYAARIRELGSSKAQPGSDDEPPALLHFLEECREDAETRLSHAKARALESGVPHHFVESAVARDDIC